MKYRHVNGELFYRMNTPKWAKNPTSGVGAARAGGRFNRKGLEALYLSQDSATAIAEYQQDEVIMPPGTLAAYHVSLFKVLDFSDGKLDPDFEISLEDWDCNWRQLLLLEEVEPPTWHVGDILVAKGVAGLLFPSTRHQGGVNLVVYSQLLDGTEGWNVHVHDPDGKLSKM